METSSVVSTRSRRNTHMGEKEEVGASDRISPLQKIKQPNSVCDPPCVKRDPLVLLSLPSPTKRMGRLAIARKNIKIKKQARGNKSCSMEKQQNQTRSGLATRVFFGQDVGAATSAPMLADFSACLFADCSILCTATSVYGCPWRKDEKNRKIMSSLIRSLCFPSLAEMTTAGLPFSSPR